MRYEATLTFPITLDRHSRRPLHQQIAEHVRMAMERGLLGGDSRLPSTRSLADVLGVSRGVTSAAYDLLATDGYLESRPGSGTYPAGAPVEPASTTPRADKHAIPIDLRPGRVSNELLPLQAWRAAWREASFRRPPAGTPPALGEPVLREAIREQLAVAGALRSSDREVVITGGSTHGLRVVLAALGVSGRQVAMPEPAPPALHRAAAGYAGSPTALAVDRDGARVDAVPASCRAVVLTPHVQAPLGHALPGARHEQAAAWAARTGGTVVEIASDWPSANRIGRPLPAPDDESVLLGDLPVPALQLGYMLVPRRLAQPIERLLVDHGGQPSAVTQLAAATLVRNRTVHRVAHHVERVRAERRTIVVSALGSLRSARYDGGALLHLSPRADAERTASTLLSRGVRLDTLRPYYFSGRRVPPALVFGYGHPSDAELGRALTVLRMTLNRRWIAAA